MKEFLDDIQFSESYILGWKYLEDVFILYTDVLLKETHPRWERFNSKSEFGCYKLATVTFHGIESLVGVEIDSMALNWDENLNEYHDYGEINCFETKHNIAIISLDNKTIEIRFSSMNIEVLDSQHFI